MRVKKTGDMDVDANFNALDADITTLTTIPILRGRHIADVALPDAATVDVVHHLGRVPLGWICTDLQGAVTYGAIQRVNGEHDRRTILKLQADGWGADITVSLWVY